MKGGIVMGLAQPTTIEELPLSLDVNILSKALGISKGKAYELCHSQGFPAIIIGKKIIVPKLAFIKWMENPAITRARF